VKNVKIVDEIRNGQSWGSLVAQSVERWTLDFGSGHEPRVVR